MIKIKAILLATILSASVLLSACSEYSDEYADNVSKAISDSESLLDSLYSASEPTIVETTQPVITEPVKEEIDLSEIPKFSDKAYIEINDNKPYFTSSEITSVSFEKYSDLDELDRCGVAIACIGKDIMPDEERGNIGSVKPSGWQTVKYDFVDGKYLYNRCHLIGYQLAGENANTKNLITGTRYLNIQGMLPFENMVADYIKETDNHVMYRVTPIFDNYNLLASGVQMEGYSVEDNGEGICFNVYCYNSQPYVTIDYSDGTSKADSNAPTSANKSSSSSKTSSSAKSSSKTDSKSQSESEVSRYYSSEVTYVLNTNTYKFHLTSCSYIKRMNESNKQYYTGSREDVIAQGYDPCKKCNP